LFEKAKFDVLRLPYQKYTTRDHNEGHGGFAILSDKIVEDVRNYLEERRDKPIGREVTNAFIDMLKTK